MLNHTIDPVFNNESKVLLLGSFPSPKSREQGFFYGHPQNRMWRVLAALFDEEIPMTVEDRREFLLSHRIAMWDVLASCEIHGASDASIRDEQPNDLSRILEVADIRAIFTTGSKAAEYYRKYNGDLISLPHFRLPSTSPANAVKKLDDLIEAYQVIKKHL